MSCLASGPTKCQLERVQKRFLKLLLPPADSDTALQKTKLDIIDFKRKLLVRNLSRKSRILHKLLSAERQSREKLRRRYPNSIPEVKKSRFGVIYPILYFLTILPYVDFVVYMVIGCLYEVNQTE